MKKVVFLLTAVLSVFSLVSCGGKSETAEKQEKKEPVASEPSVGYEPSMFLSDKWAVFTEKDDGKMYAVLQAETGDVVYLAKKGSSYVSKKAFRKYSDGKEEEGTFIQIKYNDRDYWTTEAYVANEPVELGIIAGDCRIFSSADDTAMTKKQLKDGTSVVASSKNDNESYSKIITYDGNAYGKAIWVPSENLITNSTRVEIIKMQQKLTDETKPEVRKEIEELIEELLEK